MIITSRFRLLHCSTILYPLSYSWKNGSPVSGALSPLGAWCQGSYLSLCPPAWRKRWRAVRQVMHPAQLERLISGRGLETLMWKRERPGKSRAVVWVQCTVDTCNPFDMRKVFLIVVPGGRRCILSGGSIGRGNETCCRFWNFSKIFLIIWNVVMLHFNEQCIFHTVSQNIEEFWSCWISVCVPGVD